MADEIKQSLGFDVSQSLDALKQLDSAFASFEKNVQTLATTLKNFNGNGSKVVTTAKQIGNAFQSGMGKAAQSTEQLTVSWQMMARIVTTQAIVRALSQIRNTLQDAAGDAIAFQKQLAEIQTISPGSTIGALSNETRALSDAFNIPLLEVAASKYEAISNGFSEASENLDVLSASFKFSKVAQTDAGRSLDLISGVLNSYNLDAKNAEAISAKLFKTIEIGKVTGDQLASSLGRVSPAAAAIGVSFDEVLTQFAALTISGVNANEAATQISAAISALVKPSEAANEAFRKLGFSSAETAIQTLGLQGTLKALISTTDGSAEAIARIFPNIRALRDVLNVVPQDARLGEFLKEIESIDVGQFNAIVGKSLQTDAERVTSEITKLKNLLTVDLGQAILEDAAGFARLTGGIDNVGAAAKLLAPVLETGIVLLGAYSAAAFTGATANATFAASFKGVAAGLLLAAGAVAGGDLIAKRLIEVIDAPQKAFEKAAQEQIAKLKQSEAEKLAAQETADSKRLDATLKTISQLNKVYLDDVANAEAAAKLMIKNADRTADAIVKSREKLAQSFDRAAKDSRRLEQDSANRILDLKQRTDDRRFERSIQGTGDAQQVFALTQRSADLAKRAADDLARAAQSGDRAGIDRATSLFEKAQGLGESAQQIGQRAGNRALEVKAAQNLESITSRQIEAELRLQAIQDQRQAALDTLSKKQLSVLDTVREQTEIVRQNSNILDSQGNLLSDADIAKRQAAAQGALEKIRQTGLSADDMRLADRAGLGQQAREFNLKLAQQSLQLDFDVTGGIQRIKAQLQQSFADFKLKVGFDVDALGAALGKQFQNPEQLARGIDEIKSKAAELRTALSQATTDDANIRRLKTELEGIEAALGSSERGVLRAIGPVPIGKEQLDLVANLRKELDLLARNGALTDQQITDFFGKVSKLRGEALQGNVAKNLGLAFDLRGLSEAASLLKDLQGFQQSVANNPALAAGGMAELQRMEAIIKTLGTANPATAFQSAATAIGQGANGSAAIADNFARAADNAERAAAAAASLGGPSRAGFASGGFVSRFATGGLASGTDTVPAMLTPGEFVVNAGATRRWFSQLQAINSGQAPQLPPSVKNIGIEGGVNINVTTGSTNGKSLGREVAAILNREIRRGTANLR